MIKASFYITDGSISGFEIKGHSGYAESGRDIVCAAVSSAAYMAANTISEILSCPIDAKVSDGYMSVKLLCENNAARDILSGLKLHLTELSNDNPDFNKITTEV